MPEKVRVGSPSPVELTPSDESLSLRLEGGAELLQAARGRYSRLARALARVGWRRSLRRHPGLVREVLEQDGAVKEALQRVEQRSKAEGWPEKAAVQVAAREVAKGRARIEASVRRRLKALGWPAAELPLDVALSSLERAAKESTPYVLEPGEVLLCEGRPQTSVVRILAAALLLTAQSMVVLLTVTVRQDLPWQLWVSSALLICGGIICTMGRRSFYDGRFWLTGKRLWWKSRWQEMMVVELRSITGIEEVRLPHGVCGLRVDGDRVADVRSTQVALEALNRHLERCRPWPGVRLTDVVICPATQRDSQGGFKGWAVVRPMCVSFLLALPGDGIIHALDTWWRDSLDARLRRPMSLLGLEVDEALELFRWLPGSEFDACMAHLMEAGLGTHCPASELRWAAVAAEYHLDPAREHTEWHRLELAPGESQREELERLLASWPRR